MDTTSTATVLSLGSINVDFQVRVERRPEISETLLGRDYLRASGGKGANVAFLARRLGAAAELIGRVGDDELAAVALAPLEACGVGLAAVRRLPQRATGVALITVPPDGKKGIVLAANANREWEADGPAAARRAVEAAPAGAVLVVDCEVPEAVAGAAMAAARERGLTVVLDPSPADRASAELLAMADVVVPNAGEAAALAGAAVEDVASANAAAQTLLECGVGTAVVKLPDGGCVVSDGEQGLHVPARPVPVVDTNGAGDAFAGALAVALAEGLSVAEAAPFACAAANLAVTGWGAQASYPERGAIEAFARELGARAEALR